MKHLIVFFFCLTGICNLTFAQDCPEGINKLPMYGKLKKLKKCKEQIQLDYDFIAVADKAYKKRSDAADHMVKRGWENLRDNQLDVSMMRFNQAWLLDSTNYQIYWGYGDLLGMQKQFKESIIYFEIALKFNSKDAKLWQDVSTTYGNVFYETKDKKYLDMAIVSLKKAIALDPKNPQLYGQLTAAYSYVMQKDSAQKYLKLTDKLDPNAVKPEVRVLLNQ